MTTAQLRNVIKKQLDSLPDDKMIVAAYFIEFLADFANFKVIWGSPDLKRRKTVLARVAGLWKDRKDLPDFRKMRGRTRLR